MKFAKLFPNQTRQIFLIDSLQFTPSIVNELKKDKNFYHKLSNKEIEAVAIFVSTEGKNWKNKLSSFVQ